jgi:hypothetical protein
MNFKNVTALYDESDTCHKLFFDIFFEFLMCEDESFKISLRSRHRVVRNAW